MTTSVLPDLGIQFARLIGSTPTLLVILAGIVLCLVFFSRAPKVCVLVGIALALDLLNFFVMPFLSSLMFSIWPPEASDQLNLRIAMNGLLISIPRSISLALLLWAAFSAVRRPPGDPIEPE